MIAFGITGLLSSGKTSASKILSYRRGPLFSADTVVKQLYKKKDFQKKLAKKLNLKLNKNFKKNLKNKLLSDEKSIKDIEQIIHPAVRKKMFIFLKKNKNKKYLFLEIPLLIESKLMKYFDVIIFIKSSKKKRIKRYKIKGGNISFFNFLDNRQMSAKKKMKFCDHIIVNNESLAILKKKLFNIIRIYE